MGDSGGLMFLRYANAEKSYLLRFDICDFDASTFAYTGIGPKTPTESDVGATFAAFAALWAPYYTADWLLTLESLWQTDAPGSKSQLSTVPATSPVLGSHSPAVVPDPPLRRMYSLRNTLAHYYRFNLRELIATQIGTARTATATSGGFDSRDRMLIGYLSSPASGIVLFDGEAINPSMRVSTRIDVTPYGDALATGVTGGGGVTAAGVVLTDCLVYPHGAVICNPSSDHLHVSSSGFDWRISNTGLTISYGDHLAWTFTPTQLIDAAGMILETIAL